MSNFVKNKKSIAIETNSIQLLPERVSKLKDSLNKASALRVNWEGSQFINHSLALVNREITRRLVHSNGLDVGIIPYEIDPNFLVGPELGSISSRQVHKNHWAHITVRHQWPAQFVRPNSSLWVLMQPWEYGATPKDWYIPMKYEIDDIWVYSNYNKQCYVRSGIPEDKIHVIPLGVDIREFHPNVKPLAVESNRSFKFLFVGGTIYRKGIDLLIQAYTEEFTAQDDVSLIIKDHGTNSFYKGQTLGKAIHNIKENIDCPEIVYLDSDLSQADIAGLYKVADCLVQPYRGEGFGLPIIEAMACGIPAIVPDKGPSLDFCNHENAFFIRSREDYIEENHLGNLLEMKDRPWMIYPDVAHLRQLMRAAYEQQELTKQKGYAASKYILERFTWENTVEYVEKRLNQLMNVTEIVKPTRDVIIELETKQGIELYQTGDYINAYNIFLNLQHAFQDDVDTVYNTALAAFEFDKQLAINHLQKLTKLIGAGEETLKGDVWNLMGVCYCHLEDYLNAMASFSEGMEIDPSNVSIHENLLQIKQNIKDTLSTFTFSLNTYTSLSSESYSEKLTDYQQRFIENPNDIVVIIHLAFLYMVQQSYEQAVSKFQEALTLYDEDIYPVSLFVNLYKHMGISYFKMGNWFKAKEIFTDLLRIISSNEIQQRLTEVNSCISSVRDHRLSGKRTAVNNEVVPLYNDLIEQINSFSVIFPKYFCTGDHVLYVGSYKTPLFYQLIDLGCVVKTFDLLSEEVEHIKRDNSSFEGVVIEADVQQVSGERFNSFVDKANEVLSKTGKIIVITPDFPNLACKDTTVKSFSRYSIEQLLYAKGLTVKESAVLYEYAFFIVAQKQIFEVLWESPIYDSSGYAEEQKDFLTALRPFPVKIKLNPISSINSNSLNNEMEQYLNNLRQNKLGPLIHYQACPGAYFTLPEAPISIGRTMFETNSIPSSWIPKLNALTEIWVPTEFNKETFSTTGISLDKLYVVPAVINEEKYQIDRIKPFKVEAKTYKFLSIFDWDLHKGWDVLIKAYLQEFTSGDDVTLILKVSKQFNPQAKPLQDITNIAESMGMSSIPDIKIIDYYLKDEEMLQLYAASDAFVMPSRGEGWGRPYMEAMAMSLPTIGTRWSGQQQFMNDNNSYLIDVDRLAFVDSRMHTFYAGHYWAEPSESKLRELMRWVYSNQDQAKLKGEYARQDLFKRFSRQKIGKLMYDRMEYLLDQYFGSL